MKAIVIDLRICQWCSERGMSKILQHLVLQMCLLPSTGNFYFLIEDQATLPPRHQELQQYGIFFTEKQALALFEEIPIQSYLLPNLFYPLNHLIEYLFPAFLKQHRPKYYVLCHDLIPLIFPSHYFKNSLERFNYSLTLEILKQCEHIFAVSYHTKKDLIDYLKIPEEQITVTYVPGNLEKKSFTPTPSLKFSFGTLSNKKYFLYVSGNDWRKNQLQLIEAYYQAKQNEINFPLVIVSLSCKELIKKVLDLLTLLKLELNKDIYLVEFVSEEELTLLNFHAFASLFPSQYEGLGVPIIESYLCGTPVIGSNTSSMKEIISPSCSFDPNDIKAMSQKMIEIVQNPDLVDQSLRFGEELILKLQNFGSPYLISQTLNSDSPAPKSPVTSILLCPKIDLDPPLFLDPSLHYFIFPQNAYELAEIQKAHRGIRISTAHLFENFLPHFSQGKIYIVLDNSEASVPILKEMQKLQTLKKLQIHIHLKQCNLLNLFAAFFNYQLEPFKTFFYKYYQQQAALTTSKMENWQELNNIPFMGIRGLFDLCKIDCLSVFSKKEEQAIRRELGNFFPITIQVRDPFSK